MHLHPRHALPLNNSLPAVDCSGCRCARLATTKSEFNHALEDEIKSGERKVEKEKEEKEKKKCAPFGIEATPPRC